MKNYLVTGLLMVGLMAVLMTVGHFLDLRYGGNTFTLVFLFVGLGMNFVSYWYSDKIVLTMYRAKPLAENQAPELYAMIRRLSQKAGIPMPRVFTIPTEHPNAFATGRNPSHAAVCVTDGIVRALSQRELEGVIAHELSHVKHYDTLIMAFCAAIAGLIMLVGRIATWTLLLGGGRRDNDNALGQLFLIIVAPLLALIIQLAVSRSREYKADERGGRLTGDPEALADALLRLEAYARRSRVQPLPATSHLFIVNPAVGSGKGGFDLFSTHPSTAKRVKRLRNLAGKIHRV